MSKGSRAQIKIAEVRWRTQMLAALLTSSPLSRLSYACSQSRLRKYQGIWIPERLLAGVINAQRNFRALPTDIFITSYPKCGTTWLKALVFATVTRTEHSFDCHPLHRLNPHECIPFIERSGDHQYLKEINAMSAPRVLHTHLPFDMLPESIKSTSGCRIVYICREPKDALLSLYNFVNKVWRNRIAEKPDGKLELNDFLKIYCDGICPYGEIWDHLLGYWNESLRIPERFLILNYEDILEAPLENLMKLAEFIGCPFSEDETSKGVPKDIIKLCSFDSLKNTAVQHSHQIGIHNIPTEVYYRNGSVGDWRNHMIDQEMVRKLDHITSDKLQGIALTLGWLGTETTTI